MNDSEIVNHLMITFVYENSSFMNDFKSTLKTWDLSDLDDVKLLFEFAIHETDKIYLNMFVRVFFVDESDEDDEDLDNGKEFPSENLSVGWKLGGYVKCKNEIYKSNAPYGLDSYERQNVIKSVWVAHSRDLVSLSN